MIHKGRKVLDEPMTGLRRQYDPRTIHFEPLDAGADPLPLEPCRVIQVEPGDAGYTVRLPEGTDPATAIARLAAAVPPARIELARLRLEDVFIRIVSEGGAGSESRGRCARVCRRRAPKGHSHRKVWLVAAREFMAAALTRGSSWGCC